VLNSRLNFTDLILPGTRRENIGASATLSFIQTINCSRAFIGENLDNRVPQLVSRYLSPIFALAFCLQPLLIAGGNRFLVERAVSYLGLVILGLVFALLLGLWS